MPFVAAAIGGSALLGLYGSNKQASAAQNAAAAQAAAAEQAIQLQQQQFNTINAQEAPQRATGYNALNQLGALGSGPYNTYDANGNLTGSKTGSGYLTRQFGDQDLNSNLAPNYQFQLQQGQNATANALNANGGGGNAAQGLQQFTQDYAGNAYQQAFTNFQNQRANIYNTLAGIAGIGQASQNAVNTAGMNSATAQGQLGVGAASALGQGQIGAANAYANAASNIGNNLTLWSLLGSKGSTTGASTIGGSTTINPTTIPPV